MKLRNKKGFITVYAMLAMMFFAVVTVTALVTVSRKIKLQTEANTALIETYNKNINGIVQEDVTTIPIYTQAQFKKVAEWILEADPNEEPEYIYINDVIYKLDPKRYESNSEQEKYEILLKTDLWFEGKANTPGEEEAFIPVNDYDYDEVNGEYTKSLYMEIRDHKNRRIYLSLRHKHCGNG